MCIRWAGDWTCSDATCTTSRPLMSYLDAVARYAAAEPDVAVDPRRRMGHGCVRRRHAPRRSRSTPWCPIGPPTFRTATATARGSTRCAMKVGGHHQRHARSGRRRIERDETGRPTGTLHEGAADLVERARPRAHRRRALPKGCGKGQAYLHSLGITAWQDAIVETERRREQLRRLRCVRAPRASLTARVVGALWWDRHRGLEQIDDLLAMRERGRARSVRGDQRQDHAGRRLRELHRRRARAIPRCLGAPPRRTAGISFVDPSC